MIKESDTMETWKERAVHFRKALEIDKLPENCGAVTDHEKGIARDLAELLTSVYRSSLWCCKHIDDMNNKVSKVLK